jgi:predicted tellurium resistance membrane protein TerC
MGVAASWIARLLHRVRWLGYLGLAIVFWVAVHMIWEGSRNLVMDLGRVEAYNARVPANLAISEDEIAHHKGAR